MPYFQVNDSMFVAMNGNQSPICIHAGKLNGWDDHACTAWLESKQKKCLISFLFRLIFRSLVVFLIFISFFLPHRSTHEVVEIDTFLYSLGGNDGSSSLNSVEKYDTQLNKWTIVNSMVTRRSSVGAAVLECFNLERGLVQTTNLWRLNSIPETSSSTSTAATAAATTTTPPLSSSVPST